MSSTVPHTGTPEIEEPERPPARRGPKSPATISPSGSKCPKQPPPPARHRPDRGGLPCGAPTTLPPPRSPYGVLVSAFPPGLRLAARQLRELPGTSTPGGSGSLDPRPPGGLGVRSWDPFRPCGLPWSPGSVLRPCGLPPSPAPIPPCGFLGAPFGSLRLALTAWSETKSTGASVVGQAHVSAGRWVYLQVREPGQRVTRTGCCHSRCITAGQRGSLGARDVSRAGQGVRGTRFEARWPWHPR